MATITAKPATSNATLAPPFRPEIPGMVTSLSGTSARHAGVRADAERKTRAAGGGSTSGAIAARSPTSFDTGASARASTPFAIGMPETGVVA